MTTIHSGFVLFSGNPGGGESLIRQYVTENDWLEDIIQLSNDLFYNTGTSTCIWIITKNKSPKRQGKVQLIDVSNMYENRHKNIDKKRVDISKACREMIVQAYGEFDNKEYRFDDRTVESKILNSESFGFTRVTIERPERNENEDIVYKKNGNMSIDTSLRDTGDINEYLQRKVIPFGPGAKMGRKKDKIGYKIPFTRLFYKYTPSEPPETISERIRQLEESVVKNFRVLSGEKMDTGKQRSEKQWY